MIEDKELCNCGCGDDCGCEDNCSCDDGCDCGCNDEDVMTITLEDGTEMECAVIAVFPVDDKDYIALLPLESKEEGEVFLYGYEEYEDGGFELISIESDEEYTAVTSAFDEILDDMDDEEENEDDNEDADEE